MSTLVIVESPTKARTIRNYLPSDYRVEASMGHVRDLPASADEVPPTYKDKTWANLGVNVEENFEPLYVIPKNKKKIVKELQEALKAADELILATDEDREGESISWHLMQLLKPKVPIKRMVFHEITREAIQSALKNCREINENLVHAQETRRILDRLVGYTLSPLLWKKIAKGLSAGRVQSVAVRLLVERERERRAFHSASYWDLKATLEQEKSPFEAKLMTLGGKKIATGSDFDPKTGQLFPKRDVVVLNEAGAEALKERLTGKLWTVTNTEAKPTTRKPAPLSPPLPYNRKGTGNWGSALKKPCGSLKNSTRKGILPICGQIPFISPTKRSQPPGLVSRKCMGNNTLVQNLVNTAPKAKGHKKLMKLFAPPAVSFVFPEKPA